MPDERLIAERLVVCGLALAGGGCLLGHGLSTLPWLGGRYLAAELSSRRPLLHELHQRLAADEVGTGGSFFRWQLGTPIPLA
jgi:hypothetical protein